MRKHALTLAALGSAIVAACAGVPAEPMTVAEAQADGKICRERLNPNSNTIQTYCGTRAQWRALERAEAQNAERLTYRLQGSPYGAGY